VAARKMGNHAGLPLQPVPAVTKLKLENQGEGGAFEIVNPMGSRVLVKPEKDFVQTLLNGAVLLDYGPMHMVIRVWDGEIPRVDWGEEGARLAMRLLEDQARFLPLIKKKAHTLEIQPEYPDVIRRMIDATRKMGESDLTPLAAVAGAASDVVADFLISRGGTKVIVDNGGDIALRLREGEVVRVGVKTDIHAKSPAYFIPIDAGSGVGGVATSGFGGRSFTKGIASAATILSANASLADAAATVVGNCTNVEDPGIVRSRAETIYPDTDIAGEWVTTRVGPLPAERVEEALENGLKKARALCAQGLIQGALIAVKQRGAWTAYLDSRVQAL
jgi:ApbE superfamily uncharacterized protein (UPF0280 family)